MPVIVSPTAGSRARGMAVGGMVVGGMAAGGVVGANEEGETSPVISSWRDNGSLEGRGVESGCMSGDN